MTTNFSISPVIQLLPIRHEAPNIVQVPGQVLKLPFDHAGDLVRTWLLGFCQVQVLLVGGFTVHSRHGEIVVVADSPDDCLRLFSLASFSREGVHGRPDIHRCTGGIEDQRSPPFGASGFASDAGLLLWLTSDAFFRPGLCAICIGRSGCTTRGSASWVAGTTLSSEIACRFP